MGISGIPSPSLSEQVALLEYKLNYIDTLAGELIATCIANLDRGTITSGPEFREYVSIRSSLRMQVMGECGAFSEAQHQSAPLAGASGYAVGDGSGQ